jgi:gamma-glutamylcyclotransferase (GGCT)/AIG2-like uncharacterized protein YtfP
MRFQVDGLLFVYGTLRAGSNTPLAQRLAREASYAGVAHFRGRLYDLGRYPGAVPSSFVGDRVVGDLYRLRRPALLRRLDGYEGCIGETGRGQEYRRVLMPVVLVGTATTVEAWVYLYQRPAACRRRIESGDWLARFN